MFRKNDSCFCFVNFNAIKREKPIKLKQEEKSCLKLHKALLNL